MRYGCGRYNAGVLFTNYDLKIKQYVFKEVLKCTVAKEGAKVLR